MESAAATEVDGPARAFAAFQQEVLGHGLELTEGLYHEDVVVEFPFARPGAPARVEGREAFAALVRVGRQALPGRFEEFRDVVVRVDRDDPSTAVVEYTIVGRLTGSGTSLAVGFVSVLSVVEGQITRWREYQDQGALSALPGR